MKMYFKNVFPIIFSLFVLVGCSKNDDVQTVTHKNVIYKVEITDGVKQTVYKLMAEYYDPEQDENKGYAINKIIEEKNGKWVWEVERKNIPVAEKLYFNKGWLNVNATRPSKLDVTISMVVSDSRTGKIIFNDKKVVKSSQDEPFTDEVIREKTSFSFAEN